MNQSKFTLGRLLTALSFTLASSLVAAADIYVSPTGGGGSISDPTDLQSALDTARTNSEDDVIYLMEGDYDAGTSGANTFKYNSVSSDDGMKVTLSGSWNSDYTAQKTWGEPSAKLNGHNTSRVLLVHADAVSFDFTMEHLDVGNGYVAVGGGHGVGLQAMEENGGAINLKIHHVGFFDNRAQIGTPSVVGGGMYSNCYFEISESYFEDNKGYYGGAMYIADRPGGDRSLAPKIDDTYFENNASGAATYQASAIFFVPSPVITNSVFIGPDISALGYYPASGIFGGWGGGGGLTIERSVFMGFHASNWGAALSLWDRDVDISNSLFVDNHAGAAGDGKGGAIEIFDPTPATPKTVTITNSTFVGNSANGGGSFGGAIANRVQTMNIVNSIFWNNANKDIYNYSPTGPATISYSDIEDGVAGTGFTDGGNNINSDPLFVYPSDTDPTKWNLRLTGGSPAIDSGSNATPGAGTLDLDDEARMVDGNDDGSAVVDMGAYEYGPSPDVMLKDYATGLLGRYAIGYKWDGLIGSGSGAVYADVAGDDYNANLIEAFHTEGIADYCDSGDTKFCPKDALTKDQAAMWLAKTKTKGGTPPPAAISSPFDDVDIGTPGVFGDGDFAADYIVWMATQGFTEGCDMTHYCPKEALTHAGFLKMLNKTFAP